MTNKLLDCDRIAWEHINEHQKVLTIPQIGAMILRFYDVSLFIIISISVIIMSFAAVAYITEEMDHEMRSVEVIEKG